MSGLFSFRIHEVVHGVTERLSSDDVCFVEPHLSINARVKSVKRAWETTV